jgi:hypothetical protein
LRAQSEFARLAFAAPEALAVPITGVYLAAIRGADDAVERVPKKLFAALVGKIVALSGGGPTL